MSDLSLSQSPDAFQTFLLRSGLMPQILREQIVERAIADIPCTENEIAPALQHFFQQHQVTTAEAQQDWMHQCGMQLSDCVALATRKLRLEKFKRLTWGNKLQSYFLKRKAQLDQANYRLIRVADGGMAQEFYFRLQAGEQSFAELAVVYSQGPEAQTGGQVGPVELATLHPQLARMLHVSQPGQLWHPVRLGEWWVIIQLESLVPAQLTEFLQQRLLNELFETWLKDQLSQLPGAEQHWFGLPAAPAPVQPAIAA